MNHFHKTRLALHPGCATKDSLFSFMLAQKVSSRSTIRDFFSFLVIAGEGGKGIPRVIRGRRGGGGGPVIQRMLPHSTYWLTVNRTGLYLQHQCHHMTTVHQTPPPLLPERGQHSTYIMQQHWIERRTWSLVDLRITWMAFLQICYHKSLILDKVCSEGPGCLFVSPLPLKMVSRIPLLTCIWDGRAYRHFSFFFFFFSTGQRWIFTCFFDKVVSLSFTSYYSWSWASVFRMRWFASENHQSHFPAHIRASLPGVPLDTVHS